MNEEETLSEKYAVRLPLHLRGLAKLVREGVRLNEQAALDLEDAANRLQYLEEKREMKDKYP